MDMVQKSNAEYLPFLYGELARCKFLLSLANHC